MAPSHVPLVILGAGYTGKFLYQTAQRHDREVWVTSRRPQHHLTYASPSHQLGFDLEQPTTWNNIPKESDIIWCFPALPEDKATAFTKTMVSPNRTLLILGSTSAFPSPSHQERTDEGSEMDLNLPRVHAEETLRKRFQAITLRLSGLYGPKRNPLNWIRNGKLRNTPKWVNLIHIEDVAEICLAALQDCQKGESYIVSDGTPRRWSTIFEEAQKTWNIPIPSPATLKDPGKQLNPQKLFSSISYQLQHPDLFEALKAIEPPPH
jgi:nucleoside-diphosphate-sugar epimerase